MTDATPVPGAVRAASDLDAMSVESSEERSDDGAPDTGEGVPLTEVTVERGEGRVTYDGDAPARPKPIMKRVTIDGGEESRESSYGRVRKRRGGTLNKRDLAQRRMSRKAAELAHEEEKLARLRERGHHHNHMSLSASGNLGSLTTEGGPIDFTEVQSHMRARSQSEAIAMDLFVAAPEDVRELRMRVCHCVGHVIFMVLFVLVFTVGENPRYAYEFNALTKDILLEEEFPATSTHILKTSADVATTEEFWQWAEGVFVPALWDAGANAPDAPVPPVGSIFGTTVLVGGVRVRQARGVFSATCEPAPGDALDGEITDSLVRLLGGCVTSEVDTAPYGWADVNGTGTYVRVPAADAPFAYTGADVAGGRPEEWAAVGRFPAGGFLVSLDSRANASQIAASIAALRAGGFVDRQTRAIFIEMNMYNPATNLFLSGYVAFEWLPAGGVRPAARIRVVNLVPYGGSTGWRRLILELLLVPFFIFSFYEESAEFIRDYVAYVTEDYWNLVDTAQNWLFLTAAVMRIVLLAHVRDLDIPGVVASADFGATYLDLHYVVDVTEALQNLLGFLALVMAFKFFKFSTFSVSTQLISAVVHEAFGDMVTFLGMFLIIIGGFAMSGYLMFGGDLQGFYSPDQAVLTLFKFTLGDFDLESVTRSNRLLGPIFYFFFLVLIVFVVLSMFLAIINDRYAEVNQAAKLRQALDDETKVRLLPSIRRNLSKRYRKLFKREKALGDLEEDLARNVDADGDGKWGREEIEKILRRNVDALPDGTSVEDEVSRVFRKVTALLVAAEEDEKREQFDRLETHISSRLEVMEATSADTLARLDGLEQLLRGVLDAVNAANATASAAPSSGDDDDSGDIPQIEEGDAGGGGEGGA